MILSKKEDKGWRGEVSEGSMAGRPFWEDDFGIKPGESGEAGYRCWEGSSREKEQPALEKLGVVRVGVASAKDTPG